MSPTNTTHNAGDTQSACPDEISPRFFLNSAFETPGEDAEWWLDLGRVDLPAVRPCNTFTATPQP